MPKHPRYQDYVIRDGQLIGEFEELYRDYDDPWQQTVAEPFMSDKAAALNIVARLKVEHGARKVVDIGCGLGGFTARIADLGLQVTGMDISETAIAKAKAAHRNADFVVGAISDHALIERLAPDVIVMAEVSWYVLNHLRAFIDFVNRALPETYLIHLLNTYPPGAQKYGRDFFTNLDEIKRFFGLTYLESGLVHRDGETRTWFLGRPPRHE